MRDEFVQQRGFLSQRANFRGSVQFGHTHAYVDLALGAIG